MKDGYQLIARITDIAQGKTLCVELEGREVLLCHAKEGFFAVDNLCTHAQARLSEGKLKGCKILCPLHGAAFDIRDGGALTRPATKPLASYTLHVEDEQIYLMPKPTEV